MNIGKIIPNSGTSIRVNTRLIHLVTTVAFWQHLLIEVLLEGPHAVDGKSFP